MYIIWLIFMALVIGYLAVPIAREVGYSYGRFGRVRDIVAVLIGTLLFGILLVGLLSAVGVETGGDSGALILGFVGAGVTILMLILFSTKKAIDEDQQQPS